MQHAIMQVTQKPLTITGVVPVNHVERDSQGWVVLRASIDLNQLAHDSAPQDFVGQLAASVNCFAGRVVNQRAKQTLDAFADSRIVTTP